jgi:hypothetical protein
MCGVCMLQISRYRGTGRGSKPMLGIDTTNPVSKWVVIAYEPGISNFKALLRFRLSQFQPYPGSR